MWQYFKNYFTKVKKQRKQRFLSEIHGQLHDILVERNVGLVRRKLLNMPEVTGYDIYESIPTYVTVEMSDGYEILASSFHTIDAVKEAANFVYDRLIDKYGLLPEGDEKDVSA